MMTLKECRKEAREYVLKTHCWRVAIHWDKKNGFYWYENYSPTRKKYYTGHIYAPAVIDGKEVFYVYKDGKIEPYADTPYAREFHNRSKKR